CSVTEVPEDAIVLDVRGRDEFAAGHIKDAINVPLDELQERQEEVPFDVDVYVICRTGRRSAHATQFLNIIAHNARHNAIIETSRRSPRGAFRTSGIRYSRFTG
ncbi:rhodanese-like domain-containing protein, partial [Brevibacterium paucivorans]|uniref:rhodanese-like domain-containing protein n=1 Tax=Brevibacterium paucivorans TaxID=170994 RepID=UPI0021555BD2